jgi:uncharacterized membrane protein YdjX (TVP38/TMEM64 family)
VDFRPLFNIRFALLLTWGLLLLFLLVLIGPRQLLASYGGITPDSVRDFLASFGLLAAAAYIAVHAFRSFLFLPVTPFTIAGGFLFGTAFGFFLTLLGRAVISATITFALSRYLFQEYVRSKIRGRYAGWDRRLEHGGIFYVAFMRMIPMLPFDAVGYIAGASSIKYRKYLIGTILGDLPGTFVLTFLGSSLTDPGSPQFYLSLVLAVVVAGLSWLVLYLKRGANKKAETS